MTEPYAQGSATRILWCVMIMDNPTSTEIAEKLDLTTGHVSQTLKRLYANGFVDRKVKPTKNKGNPYEYRINHE